MSGDNGFKIRLVETDKFCTPDGDLVTERWWQDPPKPNARLPVGLLGLLIKQVDQPGQSGKQSCNLTSHLNAWILRGYLTTEEAESVQATLATDSKYSGDWLDQSKWGKHHLAYSGRPADAAYRVRELTGKTVRFRLETTDDFTRQDLQAALGAGFIAVIGDREHARITFQPDTLDQVLVFDPKYDQASGLYDMAALDRFQKDAFLTIV